MIICHSFVVGFANYSWTKVQHFLGMAAGQQNVLIGMSFLLTTVVFPLLLGIFRALTSPFCAVHQEIWIGFGYQGTVSQAVPITLRRHPHFCQRLLQDWQEQMDPVVGLRLTDLKL